ncbi:MAG TPA: response regulator [Polyangia bacterium]|jgi:CheY-like chemotaxis protein|nr:response regulator [Polyangia bacterium]
MSSGAILIVDDDNDVRAALSGLLEEEGFAVEAAKNGREALARLRGGVHPAVILLDLMMPGMDGWDFRSEQMRDPTLAAVPVVVVSASGFSLDSIRTQFHPAAYVEKPIESTELLDVIRALVRSRPPGQLDAAERARDS